MTDQTAPAAVAPPPAPDGRGTPTSGEGCTAPADVPEPAAVQAAIETLARWLRAGRTLVCPGEPGAVLGGRADATEHAAPDGLGRTARTGPPARPPAAAPPGTAVPSAAAPPTTLPTAAHELVPPEDPAAVRTWAREHGFRVAERGRLPVAVVHAYVASRRAG